MQVTLQVDNQFGDTGPQSGTPGVCLEIRKVDGDIWGYCAFPGFGKRLFICKLEHLLIAHTEYTMTYWGTL